VDRERQTQVASVAGAIASPFLVNSGLIAVVDGNGRGWVNLVLGLAGWLSLAEMRRRARRTGEAWPGRLTVTSRRRLVYAAVVAAVAAAIVAIGWVAATDEDAAWPAAIAVAVALVWLAAAVDTWRAERRDRLLAES
jgi:hypothetical protein